MFFHLKYCIINNIFSASDSWSLELKLVMNCLALTKPAPNFSGTAVVDGGFKELKLSDYKGKYLVFFFYPLDL